MEENLIATAKYRWWPFLGVSLAIILITCFLVDYLALQIFLRIPIVAAIACLLMYYMGRNDSGLYNVRFYETYLFAEHVFDSRRDRKINYEEILKAEFDIDYKYGWQSLNLRHRWKGKNSIISCNYYADKMYDPVFTALKNSGIAVKVQRHDY